MLMQSAIVMEVQENPVDISGLEYGDGDATLRREDGRMDWSFRMTSLLLKLYKGQLTWFRDPTVKKKCIWEKIALQMQWHGYKQMSWMMCEKKFRNLRGTYLKMMENIDRNGGSRKKSWPYMEMLHELIGMMTSSTEFEDINDSVDETTNDDGIMGSAAAAAYSSGSESETERGSGHYTHHVEWSHKMTMMLLELYREHLKEFEDPDILKKSTWLTVAEEMQRHGYTQVSGPLCEKKFRNMRCTYRTIMEKQDNNPLKKTKWPYVEMIRELTTVVSPSTIFPAPPDASEIDAIKLETSCDNRYNDWSDGLPSTISNNFADRRFDVAEAATRSIVWSQGQQQLQQNDHSHQLGTSATCDEVNGNQAGSYGMNAYGGGGVRQQVENGWPYVEMSDGFANVVSNDAGASSAPIVIKIEENLSDTEADNAAIADETTSRGGDYFWKTCHPASAMPRSRDESGSDIEDRMEWSQDMTSALIGRYGKHRGEFDRVPRRKISVWKKIAAEMNRDGYVQLTGARCEKKFRNLMCTYKKLIKSGGIRGRWSGSAKKRWPHFRQLAELLNRPSAPPASAPTSVQIGRVGSATRTVVDVTDDTASSAQVTPPLQSNSSIVSGVVSEDIASKNDASGIREPEDGQSALDRRNPPDWLAEFIAERRRTDVATTRLLKSIRNDQRRQAAERDALLRELNANIRTLIGRL